MEADLPQNKQTAPPLDAHRGIIWLIVGHAALGLVGVWVAYLAGSSPTLPGAAFVGLLFGQTSLLGIWGGLGTCSWRKTDKIFAEADKGTADLSWNRRLTLNLLRDEATALLGVTLPAAEPTRTCGESGGGAGIAQVHASTGATESRGATEVKPSPGPAIRAGFQPVGRGPNNARLPAFSRHLVCHHVHVVVRSATETLLSSLQRGFSSSLQAPVSVVSARCLEADEQVRLKPADQSDWIRDPPAEAGGRQDAGWKPARK